MQLQIWAEAKRTRLHHKQDLQHTDEYYSI